MNRCARDPYIVHFTTRAKPWRACRHPLRGEFFKYLDRTAWAGWRPPRLKVFLELMKAEERRLRCSAQLAAPSSAPMVSCMSG